MFSKLVNVIFPTRCVFCGLTGSGSVCGACRRALPWCGERLELKGGLSVTSPLWYRNNARKALIKFKFNGRSQFASTFARLMAVCVRNYFEGEYDLIVFVPLNWLRQLKRGYNQTKLLANSLSSELAGTPVANALTKKARQASSQLTHELRAGNVANAISIKRGANVLGKHVLLVDDVVTTGSTLTECGRVLLEAGAVSVAAVTVCRAI